MFGSSSKVNERTKTAIMKGFAVVAAADVIFDESRRTFGAEAELLSAGASLLGAAVVGGHRIIRHFRVGGAKLSTSWGFMKIIKATLRSRDSAKCAAVRVGESDDACRCVKWVHLNFPLFPPGEFRLWRLWLISQEQFLYN